MVFGRISDSAVAVLDGIRIMDFLHVFFPSARLSGKPRMVKGERGESRTVRRDAVCIHIAQLDFLECGRR